KDKIPTADASDVIYSIPCGDCESLYIGETSQRFADRLKQHKAAVRLIQPEKSAVAAHAISSNHAINWDDAVIVRRTHGFHHRKTLEAVEIARASKRTTLMNLDKGKAISRIYLSAL